jgi:hypothetical protein
MIVPRGAVVLSWSASHAVIVAILLGFLAEESLPERCPLIVIPHPDQDRDTTLLQRCEEVAQAAIAVFFAILRQVAGEQAECWLDR